MPKADVDNSSEYEKETPKDGGEVLKLQTSDGNLVIDGEWFLGVNDLASDYD